MLVMEDTDAKAPIINVFKELKYIERIKERWMDSDSLRSE